MWKSGSNAFLWSVFLLLQTKLSHFFRSSSTTQVDIFLQTLWKMVYDSTTSKSLIYKCTLWVFFRGLFLFTNFGSNLLSLATWNFNFLFDGQRVFGIWEWADLSWSSAPSSFGDFWEKQCHATFTKFRCLHCATSTYLGSFSLENGFTFKGFF